MKKTLICLSILSFGLGTAHAKTGRAVDPKTRDAMIKDAKKISEKAMTNAAQGSKSTMELRSEVSRAAKAAGYMTESGALSQSAFKAEFFGEMKTVAGSRLANFKGVVEKLQGQKVFINNLEGHLARNTTYSRALVEATTALKDNSIIEQLALESGRDAAAIRSNLELYTLSLMVQLGSRTSMPSRELNKEGDVEAHGMVSVWLSKSYEDGKHVSILDIASKYENAEGIQLFIDLVMTDVANGKNIEASRKARMAEVFSKDTRDNVTNCTPSRA